MNLHPAVSALPLKNLGTEQNQVPLEIPAQKLSFENIRNLRQNFEQGIAPLRSVLGVEQHQTMMVAMYEGTEQLLNQKVSEFAVLEYLEGLKLTAQELRTQSISGEQFRTTLLEHSASAVRQMVHSS